MSSFASLMALSATYTQASQSQAQAKLAERNRREAEAKKRQLEQDRKDREREAQLRLKHFEEQKKEEERKKRKEEERKAIEAAVERRKAAEREALLHGPARKSGSHKASTSTSQSRRRVLADRDDDDDDGPKSEPLTREELRERKLQAELRRQFASAKRSTTTGGYQKHGRHLPGGAVDVTTTGPPASSNSTGSVKARLAAIPNTLTKLNTVKRDTRTIDEILQDRAKAKEQKILDGQEALAFDDWFGTKKKEKARPSSIGPASGENTPKSAPSVSRGTPPTHSTKKFSVAKPSPSSSKPILKPSASKSNSRPSDKLEKYSSSKSLRPNGLSSAPRPSTSLSKKRTRSPSRSESPHPKRRAISSEDLDDEVDDATLDVSGLIWGIMGKNRNHYVNMDVFSDDEDMEADAGALEREEKRSARIAREEELAAMEEERRHEEEKRRRKMRV